MPDVLETADQLFTGALDPAEHHPFSQFGELAAISDTTAFVAAFANAAAFSTGDGLVLVDTSSPFLCGPVHDALRAWNPDRLDTAVFTHGHIDHCFGVDLYEAEATTNGWRAPRVVAHEAITARFERYVETAGYNGIINQRQFRTAKPFWPTEYRFPDETYSDRLDLDIGGVRFELHHARGETDDHTWVWVPERKVLCSGDLFIWASPNCGNPQKVQRYAIEWARALDEMAALGAEVLLPGHGLPIIGADRVRAALTDSARLLEFLHVETIKLMNEGARLDDIVHAVAAPPELLAKPYLRPIYDEPEFVVRNVWRLFGGWYDGNPANLKPAPESALASELAALAGGASRLAERASALADAGDLRLAGHLAEMAALAAPEDAAVHRVRADVFDRRVEVEASTMAKGIFGWAAAESRNGPVRAPMGEKPGTPRSSIGGSLSPRQERSSYMADAAEIPPVPLPARPDDFTPTRASRSTLMALVDSARPKQWVKNVLVFAAPAAAGVLSEGPAIFDTLVAFAAFCLAASGTYFLNDAFDVEADRLHAKKRFRPIAAGDLPVRTAQVAGVLLILAGIGIGFATGWKLPVVITTYIIFTTSYSAWLKHVAVVDLGMVAAGFVLRLIAGAVAVDVPISVWFFIVGSFGSLFMVAGKRHAEFMELGVERAGHRATLSEYSLEYLGYVRSVASGVAMVGYCLWAFEKSTGVAGVPWYELSIVPFVLAILRYALLVERGEGGAPEEIVLHDRALQVMGALWVVTVGIGLYVA